MMGVTIESIGSKYAHTHTCIIVYGWYPASKELHTHTHTQYNISQVVLSMCI